MNTIYPDNLLTGADTAKKISTILNSAKTSIDTIIYLATVPGRSSHVDYVNLWLSMLHAADRGLQCRALMHSGISGSLHNISQTQAANTLHESKWQIKKTQSTRILHAKIWIVDSTHAIIGSHNLTEAAMLKNTEVSIDCRSQNIVERLQQTFNDIWTAQIHHG